MKFDLSDWDRNQTVPPEERMISAIAYLWILFFLPLILIPRSTFGRFHANQALVNLILGVVLFILMRLLPGLRWIFGLLMIIYPVWGIWHAMKGEEKPFPFTGGITILR